MSYAQEERRRLTIDTSVAVKWYIPEIHAEIARRLMTEDNRLFAPEFIWAELGNVLVSKLRARELIADEAEEILRAFAKAPIEMRPAREFSETALSAARETGRSFSDCLYLALAIQTGSLLITADGRFYNAIKGTPWASHCLWIEDVT